jgi:AcrR family transcriptional regulator
VTFEPLTPERRRAMTRRYLLDAAEVVFARDGFHGATLDDVASKAGFSKGAVYSNFKNKEDLFLELLDDRIERQFAVVSEVLETVPHQAAAQLPHIRKLLRGETFFWDETWSTLWLEFVLYARRNPAARAKLAARAERERAITRQFIEAEFAARGVSPPYPIAELAKVTLAIFSGLGLDSLIDPESVTDPTIQTALSVLYAAMDVDGPVEMPERPSTKPPRRRSHARTRHDTDADIEGSQPARRSRRR